MTKSSSEKVRNYIPDDLAFFILSKLPLKSLKRFGCVRKSWFALFENPSFMTMFRTNFISIPHSCYNDTSLVLNQYIYDPNYRLFISLYSLSGEKFENRIKLEYPNPFKEEQPQFHILNSGSITGILCLHVSNYGGTNEIVLWNPTTDEFKVIPHSSVESVPPWRDNFKRIHGFGYDPINDDYKIIRRVYYLPMNDQSILPPGVKWEDISCSTRDVSLESVWEIYSLRCNLWKQIDVGIPNCCWSKVLDEGLYLDGICHWLSECAKNKHHYLVSFYLTNEVCFTTLIPLDLNADKNLRVVVKLLMLNGAIASIAWYYDTTTFHISVLGELGVKESWIKLFVIELCSNIEQPIGAGKNGDIFFLKKDGELVYFDLCTQMIEELGGVKGTYNSQITIYNKSLLSIEKISH